MADNLKITEGFISGAMKLYSKTTQGDGKNIISFFQTIFVI